MSITSFINDLINAVSDGIIWANAIGIGVLASLMAIALLRYLFDR